MRDRDTKSSAPAIARDPDFAPITKPTECILVEKSEIEDLEAAKESALQENQAANDSSTSVDNKMGTNQQETEINKLNDDLTNSRSMAKNKLDQLRTGKQDMEECYLKSLKQMQEHHHEELEAKRNEHN